MNILVFYLVLCGSLAGIDRSDLDARISDRYDALHSATNANQRSVEMRALVEVLADADRDDLAEISDVSVDRVASLLEVDGVNGWLFGSDALRTMGCRAERVLPKLKQSLEDAQPVASEGLGGLILAPPVDARPDLMATIQQIESELPCQ